jgi:hypothetical protein
MTEDDPTYTDVWTEVVEIIQYLYVAHRSTCILTFGCNLQDCSIYYLHQQMLTHIVEYYSIIAPTCFGASAPSSGILYVVVAKLIKC